MFGFPDEGTQLRQTWIDQLGRREPNGTLWKPTKNSRVCSKHFKDDVFVPFQENKDARGRQRSTLKLKPRAIPTEFLAITPPQISNIRKKKEEIHRPGPPGEHNYGSNPGKHEYTIHITSVKKTRAHWK